jgi:hypothetical protein
MNASLRTFSPGKCPKCGAAVKQIVYGLVRDAGDDVVLGGCSLMPGLDPEFTCTSCTGEFGHGGRNYLTEFEFEVELTQRVTGEKRFETRHLNLLELPTEQVLEYAPLLLEARYELKHRGFSDEDLEFFALKENWKPFPLEPKFDVWYFWNSNTRKIELAAQFYAHGVRHVHGIYLPNGNRCGKLKRMADFQRQFAFEANPEIQAWNLRNPLKLSDRKLIPDHDLMELMRADAGVGEILLYRFCNTVPDGQMWPGWYNPEQELGEAR